MRHLLLGILMSCLSSNIYVYGQHFGGFPPSFKWRHLKLHDVEVIFPKGLDQHAARVAQIIQCIHDYKSNSIGEKTLPISVIIHNRTTESNGFVTLAPLRSEFYVTPLQDVNLLGSVLWLDLLAIHEYRHVQQFANARRGLTKLGYYIAGQFGWTILANLAIPNWFWEGDAVLTETALTPQGRGRLPAFYNQYRSFVLTNPIEYNYMKARNGSLKHYVPNHYYLGFMMLEFGREKYGTDFWKNVFKEGTQYRRLIYPFSLALKKHSGHTTRRFYKEMIQDKKRTWRAALDTMQYTPAYRITAPPGEWDAYWYEYPTFIDEKNLLVVKSSLKKIDHLVLLDTNGREKRLTPIGFTQDNYFSYANKKVVWSELRFDPRWELVNYTELILYDLETGKKKRITHKGKYVSPGISQSGNQIAAVFNDPDLNPQIHILNTLDTNKTVLYLPKTWYPMYPKFVENDTKIAFTVRNLDSKMALLTYDIHSKIFDTIIPFHLNIIGQYQYTPQGWFYQSSYQGIDAIFHLPQGSNAPQLLVKRLTGIYQPAVNTDGTEIVFSELYYKGSKLYRVPNSEWDPTPTMYQSLNQQSLFQYTFLEQERNFNLHEVPYFDDSASTFELDKLPIDGIELSGKIPHAPYIKRKRLINIHSWEPILSPPTLGVRVYSTDVLRTLNTEIVGFYNLNEKSGLIRGGLEYGQLFPYLFLNTQFADARDNQRDNKLVYNTFTEQRLDVGLRLPLNFTTGVYLRQLSTNISYRQHIAQYKTYTVYPNGNLESGSGNVIFPGLVLNVTFLQGRKKASQHIYTRFGQYISLETDVYAPEFSTKNVNPFFQHKLISEFSHPGLFSNHHIVIQYFTLYRDVHRWYSPVNSSLFARFYPFGEIVSEVESRYNSNFFTTLNLNYHFPILYPDFGFANLVYLKRIRGNMFYDMGNIYSTNLSRRGIPKYESQSVESYGLEFIFDVTLINLLETSLSIAYAERPQMEQLFPRRKENKQKIFISIPVRFLF